MKKDSSRTTVLARIESALSVDALSSNQELPTDRKKYNFSKDDFVKNAKKSLATLDTCNNYEEIPNLVEKFCKKHKLKKNIAVSKSVKNNLDWSKLEFKTQEKWDDKLSLSVTSCRFAIAETGQIIVDNETQDAWLSLVAPIHIAIIEAKQVISSLDDLAKIKEQIPSVLTLIHGPSRTGDIEQTIVLGAHGPKQVHIIFVENNKD